MIIHIYSTLSYVIYFHCFYFVNEFVLLHGGSLLQNHIVLLYYTCVRLSRISSCL